MGEPTKSRITHPEKEKTEKIIDPLKFVSIDLQADIPNNYFVKWEDLNAAVKGRLKIVKKPEHDFVLTGDIDNINGTYN